MRRRTFLKRVTAAVLTPWMASLIPSRPWATKVEALEVWNGVERWVLVSVIYTDYGTWKVYDRGEIFEQTGEETTVRVTSDGGRWIRTERTG